MTWATHPTTQMPANAPTPSGRHRARRRGLIALVVAGVVLLAAVAAAALVWGGSDAGTSLVDPSTVVSGGPSDPGQGGQGGPGGQGGQGGPGGTGGATGDPGPTTDATGGGGATANAEELEAEVVRLTNVERLNAGCAELRPDATLAGAARAHSVDMANTGKFSHDGSDGSDPGARMRQAGYDPGAGWAENIARGQTSAASVMAAWMASPAHRATILNCDLKVTGVGAARSGLGQLFWTQDFGRR
jgi:uncharacterized protein YkwD